MDGMAQPSVKLTSDWPNLIKPGPNHVNLALTMSTWAYTVSWPYTVYGHIQIPGHIHTWPRSYLGLDHSLSLVTGHWSLVTGHLTGTWTLVTDR